LNTSIQVRDTIRHQPTPSSDLHFPGQHFPGEVGIVEEVRGQVQKSDHEHQEREPGCSNASHAYGLRPRPFADSLCKYLVASLDELRRGAAKFMQLEELRVFRNQVRAKASGDKGMEDKERQT